MKCIEKHSDLTGRLEAIIRFSCSRRAKKEFLTFQNMKPASDPNRSFQTAWRICAVWIAVFCFTVSCGALVARAFTGVDADTLFAAHTKAFYREEDGRAWFKKTTDGGKISFWMRAEQMEMVLDAYERTTNAHHLVMFTDLFSGFLADYGTDWSRNEFNDDIMWMVIACTRAHLLTGNPEFRDVARTNFDFCYARAASSDLGGGLWWKTDNRSKNACVNGPGAIAAYLLGRATGEDDYFTKAKNLFLWERATLFDPTTGRVSDNINLSGRVSGRALTYNQGTFVGAANLLGYTDEARLAAIFTMNELCRDGYLPTSGENGDGGGFNGIGVRWIARFMKERGEQATLEAWLQKNAEAAWQARRLSDNLSWCRWPQPTPEDQRNSWGCSSAVVILQVVRPTESAKPENLK
jgi:predicted alpha-1,6-mannanase (GH76 family)